MLAIQPVFLICSFAAAFSFSLYARGWRATLQTLLWQLPLIALCTIINPLISSVGTNEVFRIYTKAIFAESLAWGACMGLMLASVMLWFVNATQVLSSDKVLAVLGRRLPTLGLMISMSLRLMPQFLDRGRLIESTARAASSACQDRPGRKMATRARLVSVLMGWSMEDSLETADAMRSRGWGALAKRTSYRRYRFRRFDAIVAAGLALLGALNAALVWEALGQFHFYPTMAPLSLWWGYLPYLAFFFLPLGACLVDDAKWKAIP